MQWNGIILEFTFIFTSNHVESKAVKNFNVVYVRFYGCFVFYFFSSKYVHCKIEVDRLHFTNTEFTVGIFRSDFLMWEYVANAFCKKRT